VIDAAVAVGKGGLYVNVHVQPGARKPQLRGMHGDAVKIAVREAAQDGKANDALVRFMAEALGCSRQQVEIASGHASRRKRLFISGNASEFMARLRKLLGHA